MTDNAFPIVSKSLGSGLDEAGKNLWLEANATRMRDDGSGVILVLQSPAEAQSAPIQDRCSALTVRVCHAAISSSWHRSTSC